MWKKWGPVIVQGIISVLLLVGMLLLCGEIKASVNDSLDTVRNELDTIRTGLADIRTASDNISDGIGRIQDGLSAYEIGYFASLSGLSDSIGKILGEYEGQLDARIDEIKSRE